MPDITEVIHRITYEVNDDALKKQYEQVVKLSSSLNKMQGTAKATGASAAAMSKSFSKINWAALAVEGVKALGDVAVESVRAALAAEDIKIAFDNLNEPTLLDNLRKATRGMVSDVKLMQAAITANNMGHEVDNLAIALRYAEQRARLTGESVEELVQQVLIGLGSKSEVILNNLGIDINKINEEFAKTGDFASAAYNVINQQLSESSDYLLTYGDKVDLVSTAWENLKIQAGNALLEIGNVITKEYLRSNPLLQVWTGIDLNTVEKMEAERKVYDQRKKMFLHYVKEYEQGDTDTRNRLLNTSARFYNRLSDMEIKARKEGKIKLADDYKAMLAMTDQFYKQTYEKVEHGNTTLKGLYGQLATLKRQLEEINLDEEDGEAAFDTTQQEIKRLENKINSLLGRNKSNRRKPRKRKQEDVPELLKSRQLREFDAAPELSIDDLGVAKEVTPEKVDIEIEGLSLKERLDPFKNLSDEQKKNIKEQISGYQDLAKAAADAYDKILQAQIDALDKEIALREKRVEAAKQLAERGNVETLRLEEERLQKAMEQREKFARRQQAVNSAITVSNAIAAVARAALEGGGFGSVATIAALLAALAAGYAAVTSMTQDTGAFADGVVDYKGKGGPRDDKNWVRISSGESVITAEGTKNNRHLLEAINKGAVLHMSDMALPILMPSFKQPGITGGNTYASAKDVNKLEKKLDEVVYAIEDSKLKQNIFFNEQGVGMMTERAMRKDRNRWR